MKPKVSTGYFTPQPVRTKNASTPRQSDSIDELGAMADINDSLFQKLMSCPIKRKLVLNIIASEKDNIEAYKKNFAGRHKTNGSPLSNVQKKPQYESPTALLRRRALEQQDRNTPLSDDAESGSSSRKSVSVSRNPSPLPFNRLMKGVIAFVEIKNKDQDRSEAVKALMVSMGAIVRDKFTKDVTHVIFKDGSFTTYQKAKLMNVSLVSVLWIEAVRTSGARVSEKKFPALGTDSFDHNVSDICSQLQKDYEEIIRDELHKSVITNTPLPSAKTLINRRRTLMTPNVSCNKTSSQEFHSSQDREVAEICRRKSANFAHFSSNLSPVLTSDDDDNSDLGAIVDGNIVNRKSNAIIPDTFVGCGDIPIESSCSNMDLTNINSYVMDAKEKSKENTPPNLPYDNIYDRATPILKSGRSRRLSSAKFDDSTFGTPDSGALYTRRTISASPIITISSDGSVSVDESLKKKKRSDGDTSDRSQIRILSKNASGAISALKQIQNDIVLSSMSALQLSFDKNAEKTTSTNMSSLQVSAGSNTKASADNIQKTKPDKNIEPFSKSKDSFSPLQSNVIDRVLETLRKSPSPVESKTDTSKTTIPTDKRSTPDKNLDQVSNTKISLSPLQPDVNDHASKMLEKSSSNVNTRRRKTIIPVEQKFNRSTTDSDSERPARVNRKFKKPLPNSSPTKKIRKADKEVNKFKLRGRNKKETKMQGDECSGASDSGKSDDSKKSYRRRLYNPDDLVVRVELCDDLEREDSREKAKKRKSDEGRFLNPFVCITQNILLTRKAKEFVDGNNFDIEAVLSQQSEESDGEPEKKSKKSDIMERERFSCDDEQRELAKEVLAERNKRIEEIDVAKPTQDIIEKNTKPTRRSVRLTQKPKTPLHDLTRIEADAKDGKANKTKQSTQVQGRSGKPTKRLSSRLSQRLLTRRNSSSSGTDDKNKPVLTSRNRRSTMEFQTKSEMSTKKNLKIDKIKQPSIVCTKMHKEDIQIFNQIVKKLGGFVTEDEVTKKTTHLVAKEAKRTINMLRAITTGCWILKQEWLLKSLEAGKWLPEEDFEETEFSPVVQSSRLQRQAFGPSYSMDIFRGSGSIYIARGSTPRCSDLKDLVELCKGKLATTTRNAAIIVGGYTKLDGVTCVKETWILDSITWGKKMPLKKYLITSNTGVIV